MQFEEVFKIRLEALEVLVLFMIMATIKSIFLLTHLLLADKEVEGEGFARFHSDQLEREKGLCCKTKRSALSTKAQGKDEN